MDDRLYHSRRHLPELIELEQLILLAGKLLRTDIIGQIQYGDINLPFYRLELGSDKKNAPTLILIGGIHGIERIGTQVILAFLRSYITRLKWDPLTRQQLEHVRLIIYPIVNPAGMWANRRCNGQGVDLMRNAPVEAEQRPAFMVGGHRISKHLPWYRGKSDSPMELEAQLLCDDVALSLKGQSHCISLDCHSGFGKRDRVWFPYAKTRRPWPNIHNALALTQLFESSYPNHDIYLFEPQANSYTTHGDLWDFIYDQYVSANGGIDSSSCYLPLTLELGSWLWLKKNPSRLFNRHSMLDYSSLFNPMLPHRHARILRRHLTFFEFLLSAVRSMGDWQCSMGDELYYEALNRWYQTNG